MNLENVLLRGTRAAQPAANTLAEGTLYFVTDELKTEQSRGGAWVSWTDGGASGITALTGDVTATGPGSVAATIANNAVTTAKVIDAAITYAKLQDISATQRVLARKTAGAGDVEEATLSEILDFITSAAQGDILYRGAATWARLAAGTSGHFLQTQGAAANPQWAAAGGTSVVSRAAISITNAEILNLSVTPKTIVAAPGAGRILIPIQMTVHSAISTAGYNTSQTGRLRYNGSTDDIFTPQQVVSNINYDRYTHFPGPATIAGDPKSEFVNKALEFSLAGVVTGGNAANTLGVSLLYMDVAEFS